MRRTVAFVAGTLIALACAREARATATLMNGLGGPRGYGTSCMPPNDDGSYPLSGMPGLDLTPAFPMGLHFYSGSYKFGWINNNGSLSFNSAISTYTPNAFPGAPQPMIAPYWADVDTRTATECADGNYPSGGSYPATNTCNMGPDYSAPPTSNGVWWSLTPGQMVITWDQVGYFLCHTNLTNSFQMILTATGCGGTAPDGGVSGIDFDIEFRYNQCQWETGDASGGTGGFGGTPAQAGFDSAEVPDTDFASLPMSRMAGISTELCNNSNLTPPQPGIWRFSVRGGVIECPNAGKPCVTGQPGICSAGEYQCTAMGATTCVPLTPARPSQCNGLDNNCDGMIDTGPCPTNDVCSGAECVPKCSEGSCPAGDSCDNFLCVETDCIGITCPQGKRCSMGKCVDECSGVVCPLGQVCRFGTCVDPCLGLNCGTGEICQDGICVPTCPCNACPATQTCITTGALKGACIQTGCANVTCPAGQTCEAADAGPGTCVDDCKGAVCPPNQICQTGMCIPHVTPIDAGMGLMMPDASMPPPSDGGSSSGGGSDASAGMDGGSSDFGDGGKKSGCGCRTTSPGDGGAVAIGLGLGLVGMVVRRRRRK